MRLISLNIWGGTIFDDIVGFIKKESDQADIFCLQEVFYSQLPESELSEGRYNIFQEIEKQLPSFVGYFSPMQDGYDYKDRISNHISFGLAIFIRKGIQVESFEDFFIFGERNSMEGDNENTLPYNAQCVTIFGDKEKKVIVCNIHGISLWPKTDTPERLKQSEIIMDFLKNKNPTKILCGDFNLFPETESLRILENGMKSLIKEFNIKNTRSIMHKLDEHVSDYVITSQDVIIQKFCLPNIAVSDHLPLVLDFSL